MDRLPTGIQLPPLDNPTAGRASPSTTVLCETTGPTNATSVPRYTGKSGTSTSLAVPNFLVPWYPLVFLGGALIFVLSAFQPSHTDMPSPSRFPDARRGRGRGLRLFNLTSRLSLCLSPFPNTDTTDTLTKGAISLTRSSKGRAVRLVARYHSGHYLQCFHVWQTHGLSQRQWRLGSSPKALKIIVNVDV